jgi:hypothetical protein
MEKRESKILEEGLEAGDRRQETGDRRQKSDLSVSFLLSPVSCLLKRRAARGELNPSPQLSQSRVRTGTPHAAFRRDEG